MVNNFLQNFKDPKYLLKIAVIAAIYYFSAKFGLSLAYSVKQVTLVWPPTGISLAILILFGRKLWPGITIGAFLANLTTNETPLMAMGIAIGNTLEAYTGAYLLQKFNFDKSLTKVKDVTLFVTTAVFATTISATIGTASLVFGGIGSWSTFWLVWLNWWVGDLIGAMVVAPAILVWFQVFKFRFNFYSILEWVFLNLLLIVLSVFIFTGFPLIPYSHQVQFKYIMFPFLLWGAYKFKEKGATLGILLVTSIAVWGAVVETGPFVVPGDIEKSLLFLDSFIAAISLTFLVFSAIVHEKEGAEEKVAASEKRFRALIENSSDVIVLLDATGSIRYTSPSTSKILQFTPEELLGTSAFDRIYPADKPRLIKLFQKLASEPGKTINTTFRLVRKDQSVIWVDGTGVNLLGDPDVSSIIVNYRDITEHKKMDEAKTEFVSLAAHELRSPLSTIRWYTEGLLGMHDHEKEKEKDYVSEIYSSVLKMSDVISLLLNVSKVELGTLAIELESVDLIKLCDEVLKGFDGDIEWKKIKLIKNYKSKELSIFTDPKLLRIILENLISNSIKYTPKQGQINVSVEKVYKEVKISVKDTGVGIPENQKSQVFTKSFRADNVKKITSEGTGLGLYLVKSLIATLGGDIKFESKEGVGTTFEVVIPVKSKKPSGKR